MTLAELAARVEALEADLQKVREQLARDARQRPWWREDAGRFANDPVFDEIVELGRKYREGHHPDRRKPRSKKK
jgi:hypothetical protein